MKMNYKYNSGNIQRKDKIMTKRKNAFTLAEMLITLAVIGIVAALTIPGLVKNHNEKAWATAQDVFTKKLEVAMKAMNTDGTLTGYSTTASFVNALKKNIKITKICTDDVTKCFSKEVIWNEGEDPVEVTNSAVTYDDSQGQDWAETVGVQFNNGITALIAYNKNCSPDPYDNQQAVTGQCIGMIYDVNANKKPNSAVVKKDVAYNGNVTGLGGTSNCLFEFSDGKCISKILGPQNGGYTYLSNADCTTAKNNGEIDVDACYSGNDYYAGAVLACGGKKANLPSQSQLKELAEYIYEGSSGTITSGSYSGTISMNTTNAQSFLAQSPYGSDASNSSFSVWSAVEKSSDYAYNWGFKSFYTGWYCNYTRLFDGLLAVCLGD